jgi:hypothetical protein
VNLLERLKGKRETVVSAETNWGMTQNFVQKHYSRTPLHVMMEVDTRTLAIELEHKIL